VNARGQERRERHMTSDTATTEHDWTYIGQRLDRTGKAHVC